MKILKFDEFSQLYEAKKGDFSVSEPVGLAVLGAPAGGKSYTVKKIKDVTNDARLTKALTKGVDLTVDKLRAEFQSQKPLQQLEGFLKSFYVMRDKAISEPEEYGKWFSQIKNLWTEKLKSLLPDLKIDIEKDELLFGGKPAIENIELLRKTSEDVADKAINSLDKYEDYKRVTRYFQSAKQDDAIDKVIPVTYDEAGDEPQKIVGNMKKLHNRGYVTDVFLIHPSNIASNLIQNFFRVISGNDGGRDSSKAIIQAYKDIEKQKDIYSNNAERTIVVNSKDIEDAEKELKAATISDDPERGDKPIDVMAEIRPMSPKEGYKIFIDKLKKEGKPGDDKLFIAMLKLASAELEDLPDNAKKSLKDLTKSMSNKEAVELLQKAAEEGKHLFKHGGITPELAKKAAELLK